MKIVLCVVLVAGITAVGLHSYREVDFGEKTVVFFREAFGDGEGPRASRGRGGSRGGVRMRVLADSGGPSARRGIQRPSPPT